jgi:hypothetical protein
MGKNDLDSELGLDRNGGNVLCMLRPPPKVVEVVDIARELGISEAEVTASASDLSEKYGINLSYDHTELSVKSRGYWKKIQKDGDIFWNDNYPLPETAATRKKKS